MSDILVNAGDMQRLSVRMRAPLGLVQKDYQKRRVSYVRFEETVPYGGWCGIRVTRTS